MQAAVSRAAVLGPCSLVMAQPQHGSTLSQCLPGAGSSQSCSGLGTLLTSHGTAAAWQHRQLLHSCPTRSSACRSERTYSHVVRLLNEYNVDLSGILLKPNMCLPGGQLPLCGPVTAAGDLHLPGGQLLL